MKGATKAMNDFINHLFVSIHAPVKGATVCDMDREIKNDKVSIHAPVKGAT